MSNKNNNTDCIFRYDEVFSRVKSHTDIKNQNDLGKIVGVTQAAVSRRKNENTWPEEWAVRIALKYGLLTEWILTGEGPETVPKVSKYQPRDISFIDDIEEWIQHLSQKDSRQQAWFEVEFENKFPMFKEWKKRRDSDKWNTDTFPDSKIA